MKLYQKFIMCCLVLISLGLLTAFNQTSKIQLVISCYSRDNAAQISNVYTKRGYIIKDIIPESVGTGSNVSIRGGFLLILEK